MAYAVKEIFRTLQGEGANAGRVAVFCRFTGCNLWSGREADRSTAVCQLCDTNFLGTDGVNGGKYETAEALVARMDALWVGDSGGRKFCVLTGGEPTLQVDANLGYALSRKGWEIAMETNGTRPVPARCADWITVSPKAGTVLLQTSGHELKIVYPQHGVNPADFEKLDFKHFFLSPKWVPDAEQWKQHTEAVVRYCLERPKWRLSVQSHKFVGIA